MSGEPSETERRLAVAQLEIDPGDVQSNRERALSAIDRAAARDADIVALPELFTIGYFSFECYQRSAEALDGETFSTIAEAAAANGVAVVAGSIVEDLAATTSAPVPAEEGLANTVAVFDSRGNRVAIYRKHHLFGYGSPERELLVPGDRTPVVEVAGVRLGISTCYDLRFPELYRELLTKDVELVVVPSAWPYPRVEHWETLARARAIENLSYVATANGAGSFEEATLLGRSTVYDPWGVSLASSGDEATLVEATVDPARVRAIREEFPAVDDRRPDRWRE